MWRSAEQKSSSLKKEVKRCKEALNKEHKKMEGAHTELRRDLDGMTKIIKEIKESGVLSLDFSSLQQR